MESSDPFSDDFYSIQLSIKRNQAAQEKFLKHQTNHPNQPPPPPPAMVSVPWPTWKETRERIQLQMETVKADWDERRREWEVKEQVLGHQKRTEISRPKELLSIPTFSELDLDDDELDLRSPFSTKLWTIRQAIQRGFEALYTVQELQHLMSSPFISSNPAASQEVMRDIDQAILLLSQSVGIRVMPVSNSIGEIPATPRSGAEFSLDGGHVGALLQLPKGKRLITRSLKLLSPVHRWALLPVIIARILQNTSMTTQGSSQQENQQVEVRLLRTMVEFLQFSFQHQVQLQHQAQQHQQRLTQQKSAPVIVPFTNELLLNLKLCMKSVMVTQMEKSKLRQSLLSERARAELLHMIVQIGDKIAPLASSQLAEEWVQTREAFMSMLDS